MAAPKQQIPLGDAIKNLTGGSDKLVRELEKSRKKLEKEIDKSIKSVGVADAALVKKLRELNQRESAARAAVANSKSPAYLKTLQSARGNSKDLSGTLGLLTGSMSLGDLRDVSSVGEMAAERLANAGHIKSALAVSKLGALAGNVATGLGFVGAAAGVAMAGYELGQSINKLLFGDPEKMMQQAKRDKEYQENVWANRGKLGTQRTIELLSKSNDPWNRVELLRDSNNKDGQEAYKKALDEYFDNLDSEQKGKRAWNRVSDWFTGNDSMQKEDAAIIEGRMNEILKEEQRKKAAKKDAWGRTPQGIRAKAISNLRTVALRKAQEEKYAGNRDWSM